jgi:phage shock protein PspC (stress-responsive transcriptional regulator)
MQKLITKIRKQTEVQFFGVCQWWADKLGVKSSRVRVYFIYVSFLAVGSPVLLYLIMAFALEHKDMIKGFRKKRIWDL